MQKIPDFGEEIQNSDYEDSQELLRENIKVDDEVDY